MKISYYGLFCCLVVILSLSGCAGISQQVGASDEGMSINYAVKKERLIDPKAKVFILVNDERIDKEFFGDGARPTAGKRALGFLAFGLIYAAFPDQPALKTQQESMGIFKKAMTERLGKNGVVIDSNDENNALILDLAVRQFKLDFNFGTWIGEVYYTARIKKGEEIICENNIYEKATAFNLYGFSSGEKAINEAFNKAIDNFDLNSCFAQCQE